MFPLAQIQPPQLPALPEGPSLESVRGPVEISSYNLTQVAIAVIVSSIIISGLVWLFLRSRRSQETPVDPKQIALGELEAALTAQDAERYATLCANSVRRLLQASYDLPTTCQTSSEATQLLPLPTDEKQKISEFLSECDAIKFAGRPLGSEKRIQLSDTARTLIESVRKEQTEA